MASDLLTQAIRRGKNTQKKIAADEITADKISEDEYGCVDCAAKGHWVRLKFVQASTRKTSFERWNKQTGDIVVGANGQNITKEKHYTLPAHFDRWPKAKEHQCDNPVRYAKFRSQALMLNAKPIDNQCYIFPVILPGKKWHSEEAVRQGDLRNAFRPAGMGLSGMSEPKHFIRLFEHFEKDKTLQTFQYFHDGLNARLLKDVYFEGPERLYDFLHDREAVGRNNSIIVAYLLNPDTSKEAIAHADNRNGFVDKSRPKLDNGQTLKLFVRGYNDDTADILKNVGLRKGYYKQAEMLVLGEAYLSRDKRNHVEIDLFNPVQVSAYDKAFRLFPQAKPHDTRAMTHAKQETFGF